MSPDRADAYVGLPLADGTLEPVEAVPNAIADGITFCNFDLLAEKEDGSLGTYDNV